jgi:hypothetical protein
MPSAYKVLETVSVDVKMLLMWISWSKAVQPMLVTTVFS